MFANIRLTVSARVIGGYAVILILSGAILLAGMLGISNIDNSLAKVTGQAIPMIKSADQMVSTLLEAHTELLRFQNSSSKKSLEKHRKAYLRFKTANSESLVLLETLTRDNNQLRQALEDVTTTQKKMFDGGDKIIKLHQQAITNTGIVQNSFSEFSDFGDEIISYASDLEQIVRDSDNRKKVGKLTEVLDEASTLVLDTLSNSIAAAVMGTKSDLKPMLIEMDRLIKEIKKKKEIGESSQFKKMQAAFNKLKILSSKLLDSYIKVLKLRKQVKEILKKADASTYLSINKLNTLNEHISDTTDEIQSIANDSVSNSQSMILGFALIALLVSALIGFLVVRSIRRPLNQSVNMIGELAKGDLTMKVNVDRNDELGDLMENLNQMSGKLTSIVREVQTGSNTIRSAAEEIARGNMDLSQRTEEQASSLEETASSMEEMTSTVKQNADNATQAQRLATEANTEAAKGGEVVGKAITAMEDINSSSRKIADIISVVEEIAFQTNLLALNAAVEAARAGEQGRGFAVVASEVRNLAGRSSEAAKEIKILIEDSVGKVRVGSDLVDESGKTLGEIVVSIGKVTEIVSEIASANQEQASGIEQVNKSIMQMDEMTQQNAALVEEAAAASQSMLGQSDNLKKQISYFKIDVHNLNHASAPVTVDVPANIEQQRPAIKIGTNTDDWNEF